MQLYLKGPPAMPMALFLRSNVFCAPDDYIIPPIPPPAGIAGVSSLMLATADSVVSSVDATLVAF